MGTPSRHDAGFSLVESMIAILMVSTVFLAIIGVYEYFGKGIIRSKVRTIATNLAQEQLEAIKNMSYYRVVISTCTHNDASDGNGVGEENSPSLGWPNVPEKNLNIGGYIFNRYFVVEKASEAAGGAIAVLPPGSADTGLKVLTVFVKRVINGSESGTTRFSSLLGDPFRMPLGGTLTGLVRRADTLAALAGVSVTDTVNLNWTGATGAAGTYSIAVGTTGAGPSNARIFRASKTGYVTAQSPSFNFSPGQTQNWSPDLAVMPQGTFTGYVVFVETQVNSGFAPQTLTTLNGADTAWLKISEVGPGTAQEEAEIVELYNPTPYPITINSTNFKLKYHPEDNLPAPVTLALTWVNNTVPAYGYFLIAGTPTAGMLQGGVAPDAYYTATSPGTDSMRGWFGGNIPKNQGVEISSANDMTIDALAWRNNALTDDVSWGEGAALNACITAPSASGLGGTMPMSVPTLERKSWWDADGTSMAAGGVHKSSGNAFDTGDNETNFDAQMTSAPQNSSSAREMIWIASATISVSDGLSASTVSAHPVEDPMQHWGRFFVTDVATMVPTGRVDPQASSNTWVIQASSSVQYSTGPPVYTRDLYGLTTMTNLSVGQGQSVSALVYLTSTPVDAALEGTVFNSNGGTPVAADGVTVTAGGVSGLTNSSGKFLLTQIPVPNGMSTTVTLDVNPGNANGGLTFSQTPGIIVNLGEVEGAGNIYIHPAGEVRGRLTSNGTDPIPYMTVRASATGAGASWPAQDGITDTNGDYIIKNLATTTYWPGPVIIQNPYSIYPILDQNDSSTPPSRTGTVPTGGALTGQDFTILRGWGKITGLVSDVTPIKTGVLILATTATIADPTNPPVINSAFRAGGSIYYGSASLSDGTYSVDVRYKSTMPYYIYNVYAWYVKRGAGTSVVTYRSNKAITFSSTSGTVNFISSDWVTP